MEKKHLIRWLTFLVDFYKSKVQQKLTLTFKIHIVSQLRI